MRVMPTSEQVAYLSSIGIELEAFAPSPKKASSLDPGERKQSKGRSRIRRWLVLLLLIVLVAAGLFGCSLSWGGEMESMPACVVEEFSNEFRAEALENISVSAESGEIAFEHEGINELDKSIFPREQAAEVDELRAELDMLSAELDEFVYDAGKRLEDLAVRLELSQAPIDSLHAEMAAHRRDIARGLFILAISCVIIIGVLGTGGVFMNRHARREEQYLLSCLNEHHAEEECPIGEKQHKKVGLKKPPPKRTADIPPAPGEQVKEIIRSAEKFEKIRVKPSLPSGPWGVGLATCRGNVRSENQDYGLCFEIGGKKVLILADGCGGVPFGQRASYLAAVAAAVSVIRSYGTGPLWPEPGVEDVVSKSIREAGHRLTIEGDKMNVTEIREGLRTTLIVIIKNKREIGYAYIGDGGGCLVRSSGKIVWFLKPQRDSRFMNVLTSSLGPILEGGPATGTLKTEPGDLIIAGTDGVFDRVEADFAEDVLRGCIRNHGNLQETSEAIVAELAAFKDEAGYICDDNLALGLMCDSEGPKLPGGFWKSLEERKFEKVEHV